MSFLDLDGKRVLVTGGTGTVGSQVVKDLLTEGSRVTVYSRDQNKQFVMNNELASNRVTYVNGDICDYDILERTVRGVEYVVHCAASKHLPLCEKNADSAIKINVEGTRNVLRACYANGITKFLLLSTDKAVNPTSVMGATKFLVERLTLEFRGYFPCSVVRLGNVFASNGSVVPTFKDRIKNNLPLVVNSPNAIRYFLTKREAGRFIVDRLKDMKGGEIFVKKMKVMTIMQLAEVMRPDPGYEIKIGAMSQGEKMREALVTEEEAEYSQDMGSYYSVYGFDQGQKKTLQSSLIQSFTNQEIRQMLEEMRYA